LARWVLVAVLVMATVAKELTALLLIRLMHWVAAQVLAQHKHEQQIQTVVVAAVARTAEQVLH
jgi:hypothetical protein